MLVGERVRLRTEIDFGRIFDPCSPKQGVPSELALVVSQWTGGNGLARQVKYEKRMTDLFAELSPGRGLCLDGVCVFC